MELCRVAGYVADCSRKLDAGTHSRLFARLCRLARCSKSAAIWGTAAVALTHLRTQPLTLTGRRGLPERDTHRSDAQLPGSMSLAPSLSPAQREAAAGSAP